MRQLGNCAGILKRLGNGLNGGQLLIPSPCFFKTQPKRIENDGLCNDMPASTNQQESLHRVYYMITYVFILKSLCFHFFESLTSKTLCPNPLRNVSKGNCTIAIGPIHLYSFVLSLKSNHLDRLQGVARGYGEANKSYKKVAQTLGWSKKPRNFFGCGTKNNGRPLDTAEALLGLSKKPG